MNKRRNVTALSQRPRMLMSGDVNPFLPTQEQAARFTLPKHVDITKLRDVADTIALSELGIMTPPGRIPERFEAGVRYGLAHNARTDIKTHFRPSFTHGFCFAKCFYRKFNPRLRLAASGSFRLKITAEE